MSHLLGLGGISDLLLSLGLRDVPGAGEEEGPVLIILDGSGDVVVVVDELRAMSGGGGRKGGGS